LRDYYANYLKNVNYYLKLVIITI